MYKYFLFLFFANSIFAADIIINQKMRSDLRLNLWHQGIEKAENLVKISISDQAVVQTKTAGVASPQVSLELQYFIENFLQ